MGEQAVADAQQRDLGFRSRRNANHPWPSSGATRRRVHYRLMTTPPPANVGRPPRTASSGLPAEV